MRRQIVSSVRAGESVTRVAERLLDIDKPIVRLPQHVRELRDAAQMALHRGDRNIYNEAVQKWRGRVEELGQGPDKGPGASTVRSATQQLVKDLGTARADQIDHVVDRWVVERARHQARVIARTETVEAFRDVYKETTAKQPYVVGYRWQLSGSHPKPDECDVYAHQDVDGLGPGGYLAEHVPSSPHPHDLCSQVAIIDNQFFKRELAKQSGEQEPPKPWESGQTVSAKAWLQKQPDAFQRRLLGPTLHKLFASGRNVLDATGKPLPVHVAMGRPRHSPRPGVPVDATGAIRRDRAGQVKPFPRVGAPAAGGGKPPRPAPAPKPAPKPRKPTLKELQQTPEHWLAEEFEQRYGAETGRTVAWGKAMEHRGRDVSAAEAQTTLTSLARSGVAVPSVRDLGVAPLEWAQTTTGKQFATFGEAIDHLEKTDPVDASALINQLRASAALVGHVRSITRRAQQIPISPPKLRGEAQLTRSQANSAVLRARRIYQELGDASLVHPEKSTHDWLSTPAERGHYQPPRSGGRGHVDLGPHKPELDIHVDETAVHEWGHALENLNPQLRARARDYLNRRTAGEKPRKLRDVLKNKNYGESELTTPDELFHAYMGKLYRLDTEVTSMLTQQLARKGGIESVLESDPDSFYFLLGQLRGGQ